MPASTPERKAVSRVVAERDHDQPGGENGEQHEADLIAHQEVLPVPEVEQRDGEEHVGQSGRPRRLRREPHEPEAERREQRDLEEHPGAEVVREAEQAK